MVPAQRTFFVDAREALVQSSTLGEPKLLLTALKHIHKGLVLMEPMFIEYPLFSSFFEDVSDYIHWYKDSAMFFARNETLCICDVEFTCKVLTPAYVKRSLVFYSRFLRVYETKLGLEATD